LKEISFSREILTKWKQLGNLLRMRQISIETWRFPQRNITRCSWWLYIFECLFNLYDFFAWDKVKCTLRFQCIEYLVWTAIEYYKSWHKQEDI
jgi:hypothetical protein